MGGGRGEEGRAKHKWHHPQSSHGSLSDDDFGVSEPCPYDFNEALHMHIEDSGCVLCHLPQNEHSCIASVALAFST